jgi:hypothetical protein
MRAGGCVFAGGAPLDEGGYQVSSPLRANCGSFDCFSCDEIAKEFARDDASLFDQALRREV